MIEILGWCTAITGGIMLSCALLVGTIWTVLSTISWLWDKIMWIDPNSGYEWERVPCHGFKRRLWFTGIKVGRFGFGMMGVKTVVDKDGEETVIE
jgi:hypothetical protein